ncbi:MAG: RNA polymerase-binding protein DksA [Xanthomonadales bacterium]|nr:RNA polymerase-binding protein DksA [Xanthomonadales bacterium]
MAKPAKKPAAKAKAAKSAAKAAKKPAAKKAASKTPAKKPAAKPVAKSSLVSKLKSLLGKGKSPTKPTKPTKPVKPAKPVKSAKPAKAAKPAPARKPSKAVKPAAKKPASKPVTKPVPKPAAKPTAKPSVKPLAKPTLAAPVVKPTMPQKGPAKAAAQIARPIPPPLVKPTPAPGKPASNVRKAVAVAPKVDKNSRKQQSPMQPVRQLEKKKPVRVNLPAGYRPNAKERYMNEFQVEYFRQKLLGWKNELVEESKQTIDNLRDEVRDVGDEAERATRETENSLELRTRDRYRKLISKIDEALRRIEDGEYGFCIDTAEDIGLDRLEARPTAERTVDAQERWEHRQRQIGD